MKKNTGLLFLLSSLIVMADTVLVPLPNGQYEVMNTAQLIPEQELKIQEIKNGELKEQIYITKTQNEYVTENIVLPTNNILEDNFKIGINYENTNYKFSKLKDNKNVFQSKVISDFLNSSQLRDETYEDSYLFSVDIFGENTKFKKDNGNILKDDIKERNYGFVTGVQYSWDEEIYSKFNIGYAKSKVAQDESNNLFLSIDNKLILSETDNYLDVGFNLGYLHGKNENYKVDDMVIALAYANLTYPLFETTINIDGKYETSFLSNKIGLGLHKLIELDNMDLNIGIASDYVFGYKDNSKKLYTHIREKNPTAKIEVEVSGDSLAVNPYYEITKNSMGISVSYKF